MLGKMGNYLRLAYLRMESENGKLGKVMEQSRIGFLRIGFLRKLLILIHICLIVMVTQGHKSLIDVLRGSTTEQILRNAQCPVLAIPID